MAYSSRPTSMLPGAPGGSSMRQPSGSQSQQSSALSARIAAKKAELENLRQLRDLSGTLAIQMQALDNKISTLKDGTEAVAYVLSNWDNVLRAITLASKNVEKPRNDARLPSTLVRIPAEPRDKTGE
ncbi:Pc16g01750 [Penicillium rubens Wisconsin 54-1255]|uniref:DASH complex subunit DAD2 n=1 Tax=Penicillium rubens (strain ATCC 28089 / DSM 1075 / NRRL 1951 / Wisconsin 54-1255) TaxID=500485 RepID=B6H753_PENRW|nr:Pc16g01750 [Penicillium rubens Wisconsin 54-1255]